MSKIAISASGGLGDIVELLPIFSKFQGHIVVSDLYKELFSLYNFRIIWWEEKKNEFENIIRIAKKIYEIKPEIVYGTYPNGRRINILLTISPGKKIFCDDGNYNLSRLVSLVKLSPGNHPLKIHFDKSLSYAERNSIILGIKPDYPFDFAELEEYKREAEEFAKSKYVIIHPTAKYKTKSWPIDNFIKIAKKIIGEGLNIVFVLGKEDKFELSVIKKNLEREEKIGKLKILFGESINKVISYVKRAFFSLCNDSAVAHISGIAGVKTFVIYGYTRYYHTAPPNSEIIRLDLPCSPCYNFAKGEIAVKRECKINIACLREISENMVWEKIKDFLYKTHTFF